MTGDTLSGEGSQEYRPEASYSENAEFWIKIIRDGLDPYRVNLTDDAVLRAVGDCAGRRVLDAGCGEGYLSRKLALMGAEVTGVDATPALVAAARSAAEGAGLPINHQVADLAQIPSEDSRFDIVVCNHVVGDLEDPGRPFAEFSRVLKPGGHLVIMMLHPCFYTPHAERETLRRYATPMEYFSIRSAEQEFVVSGIVSPAKVKMWLRPLESYVSLLTSNGLVLTSLQEPHPEKGIMESDPWWQTNFVRPLFLLITAEKR